MLPGTDAAGDGLPSWPYPVTRKSLRDRERVRAAHGKFQAVRDPEIARLRHYLKLPGGRRPSPGNQKIGRVSPECRSTSGSCRA